MTSHNKVAILMERKHLPASQVAQLYRIHLANTGDTNDTGSIPGLGRFPGEGNGNLLHYSCLDNSMDGEAWQATVHGVTKSQMQLSTWLIVLVFCLQIDQSCKVINLKQGESDISYLLVTIIVYQITPGLRRLTQQAVL